MPSAGDQGPLAHNYTMSGQCADGLADLKANKSLFMMVGGGVPASKAHEAALARAAAGSRRQDRSALAGYSGDGAVVRGAVSGAKVAAAGPRAACLARHLKLLLATLPRERRRRAIERLSAGVRRILLSHMEDAICGGHDTKGHDVLAASTAVQARKLPDFAQGGAAAGACDGCSRIAASCGGIVRGGGCADVGIGGASAGPSKVQRVDRRTGRRGAACTGGVCRVASPCGPRYFARIKIEGISINSRSTSLRREADRLRALLAGLREAGASARGDASWLLSAFSSLGDAFHEEQWGFRVLVDARAWVGQVLSTRQTTSLGQALAVRARLQDARLQGWAVLRAALEEWAPRRRRCLGGASDRGAEDGWLALLDERRAKTRLRRSICAERRRARDTARMEAQALSTERRVDSVARRLDVLLKDPRLRDRAIGGAVGRKRPYASRFDGPARCGA
eukprot:TRINITY_DN26564_c0_g2_i1.p1 TRINITY_DN26564_c0_g2~~TRINITY_DN26564_c0_g2_i1.p1  ORF type:complete len:452 (-),score=79.89 TRINITY_DN26564_c0_g2_i1:142-1497(-)